MANSLIGPVWSVDTASATALTRLTVRLHGVRWVSKTATAGDDATIKDLNGNVIWKSVASGTNYREADSPRRVCSGLVVDELDSGTLYLEID